MECPSFGIRLKSEFDPSKPRSMILEYIENGRPCWIEDNGKGRLNIRCVELQSTLYLVRFHRKRTRLVHSVKMATLLLTSLTIPFISKSAVMRRGGPQCTYPIQLISIGCPTLGYSCTKENMRHKDVFLLGLLLRL